jgi:hypothetical protein
LHVESSILQNGQPVTPQGFFGARGSMSLCTIAKVAPSAVPQTKRMSIVASMSFPVNSAEKKTNPEREDHA